MVAPNANNLDVFTVNCLKGAFGGLYLHLGYREGQTDMFAATKLIIKTEWFWQTEMFREAHIEDILGGEKNVLLS